MAVMSTPKTGANMTSWDYYVVGKQDWKRYEKILKVETKNPTSIFIDTKGTKISNQVYKNGDAVQLLDNKSYNINNKVHARVKIKGTQGYLPISKLSKPPRNTTEKEDIALSQLNESVKKRNTGNAGVCIIIKNGNKVAYTFDDVASAKTFSGTPKADFSLNNSRGSPVCFISHKDAGGAKGYQQYVSLTGNRNGGNQNVNQHPLVKDFLKRLTIDIDEVVVNKRRPMRVIPFDGNGKKLMNYSIFGNDYGQKFGKEHCHFIAQGSPTLIEADPKDKPANCGIAYELKFSEGIEVSGDLSHFTSGGYEPVIFARYSSGRNFYVDGTKFSDARILIAPKILVGSSGYEV
jgi:hypothetical protein